MPGGRPLVPLRTMTHPVSWWHCHLWNVGLVWHGTVGFGKKIWRFDGEPRVSMQEAHEPEKVRTCIQWVMVSLAVFFLCRFFLDFFRPRFNTAYIQSQMIHQIRVNSMCRCDKETDEQGWVWMLPEHAWHCWLWTGMNMDRCSYRYWIWNVYIYMHHVLTLTGHLQNKESMLILKFNLYCVNHFSNIALHSWEFACL